MAAAASGIEHSVVVHMPITNGDGGAASARHGGGQGEVVAMAERRLNRFVRCVALIERLGNALGTLAFTWATVVLLGGYPTVLRLDFWFAIAICFLEAFRMFSRHNRMDYQLFFGTRGAFRFLGWSGLVLMVYLNGVACMIDRFLASSSWGSGALSLPLQGILVAVGQFVCPRVPTLLARRILPLRRVISLWSPMAGIILVALSVLQADCHFDYRTRTLMTAKPVARWTVYTVLLVVVVLVSVSRLRFPSIIKLVDMALGRKQEFWRRVVLNSCMVGAILMATLSLSRGYVQEVLPVMIAVEASTIVLVSFGNFQIPAAVLRVVLPLIRLGKIPYDYENNCPGNDATLEPKSGDASCNDPALVNLTPSLYIFYGMVLGQGALYLVACVVEIFSFIPRRFLIHRGGFKGQWGLDSVDLYYAHALEKCMERNVLAPNISICSFAIDLLNSDSTKRRLHGIRITHTLLQRYPTRAQLLVNLRASTEMMNRLMRMLHTGQENKTTRLFAAKVIDELAKGGLLVVNSPGIVQSVCLLLDYDGSQEDGKDQKNNGLFLSTIGNNQMNREDDAVTEDDASYNEQKSWVARRCQQVSEFLSVPQEEPPTEQDLLPVIGMSIIQSLATYDQSNCQEISKATDLIRKITRFTSFSTSDNKYTDAEKKVIVHTSLKLCYNLTGTNGEIGLTLRHKISKHPFLLRNLSEILQGEGDITVSYDETRELVAGIIRNLAVDASIRLAIGRVLRIITRLMHAFLTPDQDQPSISTGASVSCSREALRKVAGQALAMLAIGNANNCLAMLRQTGYSFIEELTNMIHCERYTCVAASLLWSVCMHARPELREIDLEQLSFISRAVLERILRAEGGELEIFIGLSSHIYEVIPEKFARDFEYSQIKVAFVKRLVDALNANMEPNVDCPGIRRVIIKQAINLMQYDSSNVDCFHSLRMTDILSTVEETISEAENYTIFMGDVGLMEASEPLSSLVARAKQLLDVY